MLNCEQMGNLLPDGAERILRALKPEAPQEFTSCLFYDETHSDGALIPRTSHVARALNYAPP